MITIITILFLQNGWNPIETLRGYLSRFVSFEEKMVLKEFDMFWHAIGVTMTPPNVP